MTKDEYFKFHKNFTDEMLEITKRKNADYTGSSSDPFANFTTVERQKIASTEQGFLTRMNDKMQRLISFVNKGELQVKDESVTDTLQDLANYCILMAGYLESKKNEGTNNQFSRSVYDEAWGEGGQLGDITFKPITIADLKPVCPDPKTTAITD